MPSADPDFQQVKALFGDICDLPNEAAQRARLAELGAPPHLWARVLKLAGHDATTRIAAPVAGMLASVTAPELQPGDRLGAWTLRAELGHGGMGTVYLAERSDGHYQQRAAIKLLRGWSGEAALAQLARERQILASLNHPHIARLIDGGSTPGGRPYLVMDYVEGQRIDVYQHDQALGLDATLDLFLMVCEAVAYAHRQLVVHCDIKPGNVLVGSDGRAMLLDFGIAQLQGKQGDSASETLALTPRYASPEQRAGAPASSASDIYSLGAMLQELLEALGSSASRPQEWRAIVRRATAEQPDARYLSVTALMSDLRRYRQHLPVAALPRSAGYVARKFARRRWPWLLVSGAALGMSAAFTVRVVQERDRALWAEGQAQASAAQAQRSAAQAQAAEARALAERDQATAARALAQRERDAALAAEARAEAERQRAESARHVAQQESDTTRQVSDFMVSLFEGAGADPRVSGRPDLSAATLVDTGRERLDRDLKGQPALQASMKGVLAKVYENIGKPRTAVELYEQAIALERTKPQREPLREAALLSRLAVTLSNDGQEAKAVAPARDSLALRLPRVPADSLELADAHNTLGLVLTRVDALDEARSHLNKSLAIRIAKQGPEHLDVAIATQNLASLAMRAGDLGEAEQQFRRALQLKRQTLGPQSPSVLTTMQSLAVTLARQHRTDEAQTLLTELVAQRRAVHGPLRVNVASALNELAVTLQDGGRPADAIPHYREAIALNEQLTGKDSLGVAVNINNLAGALEDLGDPAAEAAFRESLAIRLRSLKEDDLSLARARHNLGRWLMRAGQLTEAEPLLTLAAEQRNKRLPPAHNERVDSALALTELALSQGRIDRAQTQLALAEAQTARLPPLRQVGLRRVQALLARQQGQPALALETLGAALKLALGQIGPRHPALLRLRLEQAELAHMLGQGSLLQATLADMAPALAQQHAQSPLARRAAALQTPDKP